MASSFAHVAITGASSGIGAALAEAHAAPGVRLVLGGRDAARLAAVAARCREKGAEAAVQCVDVTDAAAMRGFIEAADDLRPLDLVYANAGLGGLRALAAPDGEAIEAAHAIIATNLAGVVNTVAPALRRFVPRGAGHLVLVGSLAGRLGLPHSPVYSASKAAVAAYADGLRRLTARTGVTVTLIEPGFVKTPMAEGVPSSALMQWSAPRAAAAIRAAVEARRPVYAFPFALAALLHLARHLPRPLVDAILSAAHRKSGQP
ncbi:SDR family NAD(P)-dependent oxidoreductase [Aquabacter spiritensis]|uniref:NADP-dependent 3-hydroxy acid dehydrogenase YdfG n=1 Tax=Aquabacter spiritensis TaxID=933073 RepID=A0A4R3LY43_9HYPH|nr:SDR family NAD(P)-dependent oxidoreductase [Aquabacter spiritensis]TCT05594.1 NADP-dependent 3-hydroxy acid dehydrogenase YdfG [Aquabacter spiritensis]